MNTAQDHAKAAWRSGGSVPAIEAAIFAYNQELQGRLLKAEETEVILRSERDRLQERNDALEHEVHDLKNHIRKINAL